MRIGLRIALSPLICLFQKVGSAFWQFVREIVLDALSICPLVGLTTVDA